MLTMWKIGGEEDEYASPDTSDLFLILILMDTTHFLLEFLWGATSRVGFGYDSTSLLVGLGGFYQE